MKSFIKLLAAGLTLSSIVILEAGCTREKILRLRDKQTVCWDDMIQDVKQKKIILVGESQEDVKHHEIQLRVIKAIHNQGIPVSIGLEMFRASDQTALDGWVSGKLTEDQFLPVYTANCYKPWDVHKDVFLFSRENRVPLIGLNIPSEIPAKVEKQGFDSLSQEEIQQLPPGISCNVDETYMEYIRRFFRGRRPKEEFTRFCEANVIKDNAMAFYTLKYLERHPGSTAIILSAWNYTWKRAVPRQIERLHNGYTVSVIQPELAKIERSLMTSEDADFLILR